MSHFDVSLIVWPKSQDSVHKPQFLKRKETLSGSNRSPTAYQHSALPLGQTGSQVWSQSEQVAIIGTHRSPEQSCFLCYFAGAVNVARTVYTRDHGSTD